MCLLAPLLHRLNIGPVPRSVTQNLHQQNVTGPGPSSSAPPHDSLNLSLDLEHQGQWGKESALPHLHLCADNLHLATLRHWSSFPSLSGKRGPLLFKVHGMSPSLRAWCQDGVYGGAKGHPLWSEETDVIAASPSRPSGSICESRQGSGASYHWGLQLHS